MCVVGAKSFSKTQNKKYVTTLDNKKYVGTDVGKSI